MEKKAKSKPVAKVPAAKGYKGHRAGTSAEKAHKLVDENPKMERAALAAKIEKLGVSEVTAGHWVSVFRRKEGDKPAAKPAVKTEAKKVVPVKKSAPVIAKPKAPVKKQPVKAAAPKVAEPAQEEAATA